MAFQRPRPPAAANADPAPDALLRKPLKCVTLAQLAAEGSWQNTLPHALEDHMFLWITKGQGRAMIRGVRRGIGINNVIYLPRGTLFSIDAGAQCFGQALLVRGENLPLMPLEAKHLRIRDVTAQGELAGLVEMIQREQQMEQPLQTEAMLAKFALLSVWLRRQMLAMLDEGDKVSPALKSRETAGQRLCRKYADLLESEFRSGKTMAEYAAALDVTPTHLTRVCRQNAGMTAADMITGRVLYEARRLLMQPEPAVQKIAKYLGFGSPAYFTRFMQNHTGKTPSALRRAALGKPTNQTPTKAQPVFRHHAGLR